MNIDPYKNFTFIKYFIKSSLHFQLFPSPVLNLEMIEEQPVNTVLTTIHATDADSTISEYQIIDENGDNGSEFFDINNVTGKL